MTDNKEDNKQEEQEKKEKKEKNKGGRPSQLTEEIIQKAREYVVGCVDSIEKDDKGRLTSIEVNLPTAEGLANHLGVHRRTLYNWADADGDYFNEEFFHILEATNQEQVKRLISRGLSGHYNPTIAKLVLAKHGYKESFDHTSDGEKVKAITVNIVDAHQPTSDTSLPEDK